MPPHRKSTAAVAPSTPGESSIPMASSTAEPPITPAPSVGSRARTRRSTVSTVQDDAEGDVKPGDGAGAVVQSGPGRAGVKRTRSGLLTPMTNNAGSRSPEESEDELMLGKEADVKPSLKRTSSRMAVEVEILKRPSRAKAEVKSESEAEVEQPKSKRTRKAAGTSQRKVKAESNGADSDDFLDELDGVEAKPKAANPSTASSRAGSSRTAPKASSSRAASSRAKGKARAVNEVTELTMSEAEDEVMEEDDSDSAFEASGMSEDDVPTPARATRRTAAANEAHVQLDTFADESSMDEEERALFDAAINKSKRRGGAKERDAELEKRARAAERRLGLRNDVSDDDAAAIPADALRADDAIVDLLVRSVRLKHIDTTDDGLYTMKAAGLDEINVTQVQHDEIMRQRAVRVEEKKRAEQALAPLKEREKALKKELKRNLTWGEKNQIALTLHHPELIDVWGDLTKNIDIIKPVPMEAHPSLKLTLLPFQKESLYWMKKQEEGPWKGGMLADEMGMGKTIQTIALLLSEPRQKPCLVVAPVVALMQWKHEIETHAEGTTVYLYHGLGRTKASELQKYDVVLVSYGTLEAAFRKQQRGFKRGDYMIKEKSPMHSFQWYRTILDEAHNIKERSTNAAKAAFALDSKYKWCLSGTPLQNRVGELYSLIRFLGGDPFAYYYCKRCPCKSLHWQFKNKRTCDDCGHSPMHHLCYWNNEILTPIQKYAMEGAGQTAFKKLKVLLDRMMLRRTKIERADDLGLPPRTIVVRRDYFSPEEKELYLGLFTQTQRQFSTYVSTGTVLNNYSNIFSLITRMRQMACHPDLVLRSKQSKYIENAGEEMICRICNDVAEDAIVSKCNHLFDRGCIRDYVESNSSQNPDCPVCHVGLSIDLEAEAIDIQDGGKKKGKQGILGRLDLDNWRSSTKLEALVEELTNLRREDSTIKSLVFSQFVSFLDLIAFRLQRAGFNICRLEGGMTPQARDATIQHFMNNTHVTVFLVSLKAGGVALNLTEASRVYLMDSWWNPSVEYQAMDRIHRLGQHRPVIVTKLVVEDSIESKIVQLQEKKMAMTTAALSRDPEESLGKLTPEDLSFLFKL